MKMIAAISSLPHALFSGLIAPGASQSMSQLPSGMQHSQLQFVSIVSMLNLSLFHLAFLSNVNRDRTYSTNIEQQASISEGPPLLSQGVCVFIICIIHATNSMNQGTASMTPDDVEMPGRTPGQTPKKSANNFILTEVLQ
ncbi:hypothetical protein M422DRAFT_49544 [Sphaerobolus stellatus SS14]|uniref:Uncharacterized protein n=1 Tax=Sphaerobolus stellatus (strain SS14) TaxID=990650 RepID=A0A0C9U9H0_SPHS4|nr:hypothetical protein M422DRAFT_49544 [Sphaerobolus stellatus SS14]